jgi:hypothetical protein
MIFILILTELFDIIKETNSVSYIIVVTQLSYFNPCANNPEFHSVVDFSCLSPWRKAATIIATIFASLGLGVCGIAMFRYAVLKLSDKYTEEEIIGFHNQTTFIELNSLSRYPKQRLVVENNHCMLIDDLVKNYQRRNKLENPYTRAPLSHDVLSSPLFSSVLKATAKYQSEIASKITLNTRSQLALLVKGLMNPVEINRGGGALPVAQQAYLRFNDYYQSLSNEERTALNEYRIQGYSLMLPYISGMSSTTFGTLYESMDRSCAHSVAGSFIQMLLQLDPQTRFDCSECETMGSIVEAFKSRNRCD